MNLASCIQTVIMLALFVSPACSQSIPATDANDVLSASTPETDAPRNGGSVDDNDGGESAEFRLLETSDATLKILDGQKPILTYNFGDITNQDVPKDDVRRTRACYIHPVWGLDGEVLTDDFPKDHYHHHGIFWAWPHVRIEGQEYDLWMGHGIRQRFVRWIKREASADTAKLIVENGWFVGDEKVMVERVDITVHPANGQARSIDCEFVWTPVGTPVTLWGAAGKSYGGLTFRFAPREETIITVPDGRTDEDLKEKPLKWADLSARFAGRQQSSGGAIFVHPDHPGFPPTWLTRHYGALCVGWPGVVSRTFESGQPIKAGYRIWLHRGAATTEQLAAAYEDYAGGPRP